MSEVLVGSLGEGADPEVARARLVAAAGRRADVLALSGPEDLEELRGNGRGIAGRVRHLVRRIEALDASGTGHVLAGAEADLKAGRTVIVLRHVKDADAAAMSRVLRDAGAPHVHHIGRWTVTEHGCVPRAAAVAGRPTS